MRFPAAILAISFAVACTSLAAQQQTEPLAEQQFKNIVSFKGQKASDVVPAMQFMGGSLGVQCSYCHVADRASDEKREKKTAREMIAMQKDINDKNFNGRNQVTCATCHAGHTHPINVPPIVGLEVRARRSTEVTPADVLSTYDKALAGDATTPVTAIHLTGKTTARGETSALEATYSGDKFYWLTHRAKGDQKQGFNGTITWFTKPSGVQTVPLEYSIQFVRENALFLNPESLPKQESPTGGTATIDGKDMVVLTGTLTGTTSRAAYYFDKQSGLLARTTFYYPTILGNIEQINDYSNYQKVGGVEIPMKIVNHTADGDSTQEFSAASVQSNVDASVFEPPK
jgi:hypothetical protein